MSSSHAAHVPNKSLVHANMYRKKKHNSVHEITLSSADELMSALELDLTPQTLANRCHEQCPQEKVDCSRLDYRQYSAVFVEAYYK